MDKGHKTLSSMPFVYQQETLLFPVLGSVSKQRQMEALGVSISLKAVAKDDACELKNIDQNCFWLLDMFLLNTQDISSL